MIMIMRTFLIPLIGLLGIGAADALAATPSSVVGSREDAPAQRPKAAPPAVAGKPPVPGASASPIWAVPLTQLSATRERPLFAPSRRPPPPAAPQNPQAAVPAPPPPPREPEMPPMTLVGTVIGESGVLGVFVAKNNPTTDIRLRQGEGHQNWVLRAVERRDVAVEKGPDRVILALPAAAKGTGLPATAMAPPNTGAISGASGASPAQALPPAPDLRQAPVRPGRRAAVEALPVGFGGTPVSGGSQ
jgi:hypothetical protein